MTSLELTAEQDRLRNMALARLSICKCGFRVLHDDIALGTLYLVAVDTKRFGFVYRCGAVQDNIEVVDCAQRSRHGFPPLPFALFCAEVVQ